MFSSPVDIVDPTIRPSLFKVTLGDLSAIVKVSRVARAEAFETSASETTEPDNKFGDSGVA